MGYEKLDLVESLDRVSRAVGLMGDALRAGPDMGTAEFWNAISQIEGAENRLYSAARWIARDEERYGPYAVRGHGGDTGVVDGGDGRSGGDRDRAGESSQRDQVGGRDADDRDGVDRGRDADVVRRAGLPYLMWGVTSLAIGVVGYVWGEQREVAVGLLMLGAGMLGAWIVSD